MFRNLFNPDSGLMITMSNITDAMFLSLFFLLGCLPVVGIGAAGAALYDASFRSMRQGDKHSWGRFWQVYRRNFLPGIGPSLVYLAVAYLAVKLGVLAWNTVVAGGSWVLLSLALVLLAMMLGMLGVLLPMLSRFENSFLGLLKNTVLLSAANLPRTLVVGILTGGSLLLCARLVVPLFFLPSVAALLSSFLIEPMFKPFMPQEAEELETDD